MKHNAQRIKITLEVILIQFVTCILDGMARCQKKCINGTTLRRYQISLIPRPSKIGGGEGLVHTICACTLIPQLPGKTLYSHTPLSYDYER